MGRLSGFRYREIIKRLKTFGLVFLREGKGSHEIWYNRDSRRYTVVPRHRGDTPEGTLHEILKQAGIDPDDFISKK